MDKSQILMSAKKRHGLAFAYKALAFMCLLLLIAFLSVNGSLFAKHAAEHFTETSQLFCGSYTEDYIMRWQFQKICDHSYDPRTSEFLWPTKSTGVTFDPAKVNAGDLIFVRDVPTFFKKLAPQIKQPYVMITAGEYRDMVLESSLDYLEDPRIIAWFSVHASKRTHPKFHAIPLGIYQDKKYYKPRAELTQLFAQLRNAPKEKLLYMNFGDIRGKKPERADVIDRFEEAPYCFKGERLPFLEYMKEMSKFKFSLSPRGYGPDCYRHWEAMMVGSIPVFRASHMDPLYADLPVLIINDWDEVDEEFLEKKYKEITSKKYAIEKLFMEFWIQKIENVRDTFLKNNSLKKERK